VLGGPDTGMGPGDQGVRIDPAHDVMVVSDYSTKGGSKILIFNRTDQGNTKPKGVITGPKSGLNKHSVGAAFAVYPAKSEIVIGVKGRNSQDTETHGSTELPQTDNADDYIGVWSINDNGDVPPRYTIGGPNGSFTDIYGITIDPKHKEVIAADGWKEAVMTFSFPEIF
jgi:hypothetical protein